MEFSPAGPKKFRGVWFLVLEFGLAAQGPRQFRTGIPREKAKEKKAPPPCQGSQLTLRPSPATHEGPHPISTHHRRQRRRNTAPRHRSFTAPQVARICPPFFTKIRTRFYWDHVINGANMGTPASPFFGPTVAHFLPPVTTAPHPLQGTMRCAIRFLGQKCGRRWPDR